MLEKSKNGKILLSILFWARILQGKTTTETQTFEYPAPVRHEFGEQDTHHFPETPKDHYKRIYFNAINTVTQCVVTRFEQEDLNIERDHTEDLIEVFCQ